MAKYGASFATAASAEVTLRFPPAVSARQRAVLHAVAEANGVPHASAGDGEGRSISLGSGARVVEVLPEDVPDDEPDPGNPAVSLRAALVASGGVRATIGGGASRGADPDADPAGCRWEGPGWHGRRRAAAALVHRRPALALTVESSSLRSRFSRSFEQRNIANHRYVRDETDDGGSGYYPSA